MGESLSDGHFLERWHSARDGEAFYELVRRHSGMVYATSLRMLHNPHDAEDVVQDTFLALAQSPPRIESYAGPWLHRVATNRCLDRLKIKLRREQRERAAADSVLPPGTVTWDDLQDLVDEAINALPEAERSAVVAHFLEGQTHEAIAQNLGLTRQAVSYRIKRGIEAVRETLRKKGIAISAGALAILFAEHAQATVPPALAASLGKLSLAGAKHVTATGMLSGKAAASPTVLSTILVTKIVAVVGMISCVGAIGWIATRDRAPIDPPVTTVGPTAALLASPSEIDPVLSAAGATSARENTPPTVEAAKDLAVPASVSGKVTDTKGNPIAGAQVSVVTPGISRDKPEPDDPAMIARLLMDRTNYAFATTGTDGSYTVSRVSLNGVAIVGVNVPGYSAVDPTSHDLDLQPGEVIMEIDFTLEPGSTVDGIVLSQQGMPVQDAVVFCFDTGVALFSESDGTFTIGLPPKYGRPSLGVYHEAYGFRFFEDTPVIEGQRLELVLEGRSTLQGQILTADHAPAIAHKVELRENSTPAPYKAVTDDVGNYRFEDLPAGPYYVYIVKPDGSYGSGPIDLGPIEAGVGRVWNYIVEAPMAVSGVVRGQKSGKPTPNQYVVWTVDGRIAGQVQTDEKGQYQLDIFSAPGMHVIVPKATRTNGRPQLADKWLPFAKPIQVAPGGKRQIDLVLPDTYTAAVRFLDESDEVVTQGIRVFALVSDEQGAQTGKTVHADSAGTYVWDGFSVAAVCSFEARPVEEAPYIVARVEVPPPNSLAEIVKLTVHLYRSAELEGYLIGPDGAPLANQNFTTELQLANGEPYVLIGESTNEGGYFHIQGDPARSSRAIPATAFTMRIRWEDAGHGLGVWKSDLIHPAPSERVSIGTVQLR
jgi:RNA polymerase sigma factor (sigma-70 family)